MLRSGTRFVLVYFHHGGSPFPFNTHNHIRVVAANVTIEEAAVCIDKVVVMFQAKMLENLVHRAGLGTVEFGTLYGFEGAYFFVFASILQRNDKFKV